MPGRLRSDSQAPESRRGWWMFALFAALMAVSGVAVFWVVASA